MEMTRCILKRRINVYMHRLVTSRTLRAPYANTSALIAAEMIQRESCVFD